MKDRLDDLPASDDKEFWAEADIHTGIKPVNLFDQVHYFERIPGHQAQCKHCSWGFQLEPGDKIKEGHLINKQGEIVI